MSINLEKRKAAMAMMQKGTAKLGDLTRYPLQINYYTLDLTDYFNL